MLANRTGSSWRRNTNEVFSQALAEPAATRHDRGGNMQAITQLWPTSLMSYNTHHTWGACPGTCMWIRRCKRNKRTTSAFPPAVNQKCNWWNLQVRACEWKSRPSLWSVSKTPPRCTTAVASPRTTRVLWTPRDYENNRRTAYQSQWTASWTAGTGRTWRTSPLVSESPGRSRSSTETVRTSFSQLLQRLPYFSDASRCDHC